jgi:hypothetical protein
MAIMEMHQLLEKSITRNHQHIYEVERRKIPKPWEDPLGLRFHILLQTSDSVKFSCTFLLGREYNLQSSSA